MPAQPGSSVWVEEAGLEPPQPRGEELRWFAAAAQAQLLISRCSSCRAATVPLRPVCPACGSLDVADELASGNGTIHSFTIQRRGPRPDMPVPAIVALVDLAEGGRLLTRIVQTEPDEVRIGLPVEVRFARCGEFGFPLFVISEESAGPINGGER